MPLDKMQRDIAWRKEIAKLPCWYAVTSACHSLTALNSMILTQVAIASCGGDLGQPEAGRAGEVMFFPRMNKWLPRAASQCCQVAEAWHAIPQNHGACQLGREMEAGLALPCPVRAAVSQGAGGHLARNITEEQEQSWGKGCEVWPNQLARIIAKAREGDNYGRVRSSWLHKVTVRVGLPLASTQ